MGKWSRQSCQRARCKLKRVFCELCRFHFAVKVLVVRVKTEMSKIVSWGQRWLIRDRRLSVPSSVAWCLGILGWRAPGTACARVAGGGNLEEQFVVAIEGFALFRRIDYAFSAPPHFFVLSSFPSPPLGTTMLHAPLVLLRNVEVASNIA